MIRRVGSTFIAVQNRETPTDVEWNEFLALLDDHRSELAQLRLLVLTAGGGPSPPQRKRLEETLRGAPMLVAVVSDSIKVRFVASTIALFHRDYRSFRTSELSEAYDHLRLTPLEVQEVQATTKEMMWLVQ